MHGATGMSAAFRRVENALCGIVYLYHWQQKMFDGREVTFEMLRRSDTVHVIVDNDKIIASPILSLAARRH
jgi:hypothetical protein